MVEYLTCCGAVSLPLDPGSEHLVEIYCIMDSIAVNFNENQNLAGLKLDHSAVN